MSVRILIHEDEEPVRAKLDLQEPVDPHEVSRHLKGWVERRAAAGEKPAEPNAGTPRYERLIGGSPPMRRVFETLSRLEKVDSPTVLITGESGTGKELVAEAIHRRGPRRDKPFMQVDCAAIPETLIESELFGHEKGAFTDARALKRGLFEVADGGVLFLDEIGELPLVTQAKLLRALENRRFRRVGGVADLPLGAAIITATNRDLKDAVAAGTFREDLFFRLNVVPIELPPLRRRLDDVPVIAGTLLERIARDLGRRSPGFAESAVEALRAYGWPGNVRELRNVLERVLILKRDERPIDRSDLPEELRAPRPAQGATPYALLPEGIDLAAVERSFVEQALERCKGNQTQAAKLLGISRFALRHRIDRYDLGALVGASSTRKETAPSSGAASSFTVVPRRGLEPPRV